MKINNLGGGFQCFFTFHPYLGKMNPFGLIFFNRGWNHQLALGNGTKLVLFVYLEPINDLNFLKVKR